MADVDLEAFRSELRGWLAENVPDDLRPDATATVPEDERVRGLRVLGAGRRLRPGVAPHAGRAARRRVRGDGTEGMDDARPARRLVYAPRPHRPRHAAREGDLVPARRHAEPRDHRPSAPADHR